MTDEPMTPSEALHLALDEERKAVSLYTRLAKETNNQGTRKMFEFLIGEETKHIKLIQDELDTGAYQDM
jgi:rubrerythrin